LESYFAQNQFHMHFPFNTDSQTMPAIKRKRTAPSRQQDQSSDLDHHQMPVFTIGHGTRTFSELVSLLNEHNVKTLVDIRTIPRSGTNAQHNKDKLKKSLPDETGIAYRWLGKELGGLRKRDKSLGELNAGWYNASFRGYADYMQSSEFAAGLQELCEIVENSDSPCAIMCAETYFRRCHRALVADALTTHGYTVMHITAPGKPATEHQMTQFAKVEKMQVLNNDKKKGEGAAYIIKITYPAYEETEDTKMKARKKDKKQPPIDSVLSKKVKTTSQI
jgi:Protein of unknown function, DUF488